MLVIASEAKQSRVACGGGEAALDCFVAIAPRNDEDAVRERWRSPLEAALVAALFAARARPHRGRPQGAPLRTGAGAKRGLGGGGETGFSFTSPPRRDTIAALI
jgi:hypothetical protein